MAPRFNIPPLTRTLLTLLLVLSVLRWLVTYTVFADAVTDSHTFPPLPYLEIVPRYSLVFPWVFVTATLVEPNVFTLLITGAAIFYGGRYLERAWSSAEFAKFVLVLALIPNIFTALAFFLFVPAGTAGLAIRIHGGAALQAGFLVAFKQLVPEHTVAIARGIVKIRVKHFPALFLLLSIVISLAFGNRTLAPLTVLGFYTAWIYLRFYKVSFADLSSSQPASLRGDASETFAFAYFFPEPIQQPVSVVADAIFQVLVSLKLCTPFSAADIDLSNSHSHARSEGGLSNLLGRGAGPAPGSARAEAERRRALALKALDQRLHAATSRVQAPAPASGPPATEPPPNPPQMTPTPPTQAETSRADAA